MRFDVLTLFPGIFQGYLSQSILKLALQRGLVEIHLWNIRDWAKGRHRSVDDRPFGGGPGMVLMPEPVFDAVEAVQAKAEAPGLLVMLTPAGRTAYAAHRSGIGPMSSIVAAVRPIRRIRRTHSTGLETQRDFHRRLCL
ncbi:MAG: hypothetical protein KatS3mg105_2809 [Gemmatales bacterium]|nr:MAG: hypothetical protein KatS3mg105_2809 [Gemmatales bacterium]